MWNNSSFDAMTTVSTAPEDQGTDDSHWYTLANNVFLTVDPIITFGGIIGNILAILVMRRKSMRQSSVSLLLTALAVLDSTVLVLDFINNYFKYYLNVYLLGYNGFCQFHRTIFNIAYTYATWLVTAVTVERFIVVWAPLKAKTVCTTRKAMLSIFTMPIVLLAIYFYNFFGYHVNDEGVCDVHPRIEYMMNYVSPWLTAILYSYGPLIILFGCNIGIAVKLSQSRRHRKHLTTEEFVESRNTNRLTVMVLMVSVVFMMLTVPVTVWYAIIFARGEFIHLGPKSAFIEAVILMFGLLNHGINFFLYTASSENFRKELLEMFCCPPGRKQASRNKSSLSINNGLRTKSSVVSDADYNPSVSVSSATESAITVIQSKPTTVSPSVAGCV